MFIFWIFFFYAKLSARNKKLFIFIKIMVYHREKNILF